MKWNRTKDELGYIVYISEDERFEITKDDYGSARWALIDKKSGLVNNYYTLKEAKEGTEYFIENY